MSFLFKKVAAQDLSGNVIVVKHGNIWNIESPNEPHRKLIGSDFLSRADAEKTAKEVGYSVSGVYEDSRKNGIAEYVKAQDADHTEWLISGTLHTLKSDRAKNDKGLRDYLRKAWEGAKAHNPEMKKFEGTANYKEIERILSQDSCGEDAAEFKVGGKIEYDTIGGRKRKGVIHRVYGNLIEVEPEGHSGGIYFHIVNKADVIRALDSAADSAEFKVGDKVKHTQYGTIGKVFEIDPAGNVGVQWNNGQAYYGKTAKPLSLIIAADSAAMDGRGDIRMTLHAAESQIAGVVNVFTNHAVDKTAKEIAAIDELKGVIGIIHKVASVF